MEQQTPMAEMIQTSLSKIKELVDVNTVVGTPVTTPDGITLIPVSRVSLGFAGGGSDLPIKARPGFGGGSGAGIRIEPIGFLVVKDGSVRMLNILPPPENTMDRLLDLLPTLMEKAEALRDKRQAEKA